MDISWVVLANATDTILSWVVINRSTYMYNYNIVSCIYAAIRVNFDYIHGYIKTVGWIKLHLNSRGLPPGYSRRLPSLPSSHVNSDSNADVIWLPSLPPPFMIDIIDLSIRASDSDITLSGSYVNGTK